MDHRAIEGIHIWFRRATRNRIRTFNIAVAPDRQKQQTITPCRLQTSFTIDMHNATGQHATCHIQICIRNIGRIKTSCRNQYVSASFFKHAWLTNEGKNHRGSSHQYPTQRPPIRMIALCCGRSIDPLLCLCCATCSKFSLGVLGEPSLGDRKPERGDVLPEEN